MNFRESINCLIRKDKPESVSRALGLFFGISAVGWIWYALIYDKMTALLACLAQVLTFILILLGVKQVTERKEGATDGTAGTAPAEDRTGQQ